MDERDTQPRWHLRRAGPWVGLTGLVPLLFCYVASVRLTAGWVVVCLLVVWGGLLVLALRWFTHRPFGVLVLPFVGLLVWWLALWAAAAI